MVDDGYKDETMYRFIVDDAMIYLASTKLIMRIIAKMCVMVSGSYFKPCKQE